MAQISPEINQDSVDQIKSKQFFETWVKYAGNSSKAYKRLHPNVSNASARVLGARQLAKVNIKDLLASIGLTHERYLEKLAEGINAEKVTSVKYWDATKHEGKYFYGEVTVPDHVARVKYLKILGRLLGVERGPEGTSVNIVNAVQNNLKQSDE
jgi:hypothetical protein